VLHEHGNKSRSCFGKITFFVREAGLWSLASLHLVARVRLKGVLVCNRLILGETDEEPPIGPRWPAVLPIPNHVTVPAFADQEAR
jgi:hypothetical protein